MLNYYISVIVPVYNGGPYLTTCIDSILAQTFKDFELLLIDDGSMMAAESYVMNMRRRTCVSE